MKRSTWAGGPDNLILATAILWPLGAYARVPFLPINLAYCAAFAAAVFAFHTARNRRVCRPPFEHWWPAVAAVSIAAIIGSPHVFSTVLDAIFFLAPGILMSNRRVAARACLGLALACAVTAALNGAAQWGIMVPAEISVKPSLALTTTQSASGELLFIGFGCITGLYIACSRDLSRTERVMALAAAAISACWLAFALPPVTELARPAAAWHCLRNPSPETALLLLGCWLAARVAARALLLCAWDAGLAIVVGAIAAIVLGAPPGPSAFLLLGMLAARTAPWASDEAPERPHVLLLPVLACVVVQITGVLPLTPEDPRNQTARTDTLLRQEDWKELDGKLDFLLARWPHNAAFNLFRARSLAEQGWPEASVAHFCNVPMDKDSQNGVSLETHRQALLDTLRDEASRNASTHGGLFFARALVHAGEADNALNFLDLGRGTTALEPNAPAEALARGLALLLGAPDLAGRLAGGGNDTLLRYFDSAGVPIGNLPATFPADRAPALVRAITGPEGIAVEVWLGAQDQPAVLKLPYADDLASSRTWMALQWSVWRPMDGGGWSLALETADAPLLTLVLPPDGPPRLETAELPHPASGSAAAALFIP